MLNEEKIQAMTDLAVFEKHQGRKVFPVNQFFKSDYVGGQLKGAAIEEVITWVKNWGLGYAVGLVFYLFITWKIYSGRYDFASRSQTMYMARLKHLDRRFGKDHGKENRGGAAL